MTREECLSAVSHSAVLIQDAVTQMAAFVIGYLDDEPELGETARRVCREVDSLCAQLSARNPRPWNFRDETTGIEM